MTRQTIADPQMFSPALREEYERTVRALKMTPRADGALGGPFDAWLLNPELATRLRDLGVFLWDGTSLDRSLVELAISITGRQWESNFEWAAHAPRAVQHGIPQSVIDDLLAGRRPQGTPEQELIYDVCTAIAIGHRLPMPLYRQAVATFGERGLVELMAIAGYYTLVCMILNAFEVQVRAGVTAAFAREP